MTDQKTPKPEKGEVLVKVYAVSLNYRDIAVSSLGISALVINRADGVGKSVGQRDVSLQT